MLRRAPGYAKRAQRTLTNSIPINHVPDDPRRHSDYCHSLTSSSGSRPLISTPLKKIKFPQKRASFHRTIAPCQKIPDQRNNPFIETTTKMRSSSIVSALLVATPMAVSAAGQLGFALGATNPDNSCKSTSDYEADMHAIKSNSGSTLVRIYAAGQCNSSANILPAAQSSGFQVLLGIW